MAVNQIECDFDKLAPVSERIKLDGDEYDTGNKDKIKQMQLPVPQWKFSNLSIVFQWRI